MSQKKIVCHGAMCECQFGDFPDTLTVLTQKKNYINDSSGSQKLIATDKELGMPFQAKTFGQCKMQPTGSSFKPCMPNITKWDGAFEKTQLKENQGYPLLEDCKATCSFGGSPCVKITSHGQTGAASSQNAENTDEELMSQVLPINPKEIDQPSPYDALTVKAVDEEEQPSDDIAVSISLDKGTFVPLGVHDAKGKAENDKMNFTISVEENDAEKMVVEILDNGKPYFKEEITDISMMTVGDHQWQWDGFNDLNNLDTQFLKKADLEAQVTVWYKGKEELDIISLKKIKHCEVRWIDVNIQRNIKSIKVLLRVNLKEGRVKGLNKGHNVPENVKRYYGINPISAATKSFSDLESMALEGVHKHWSRKITIGNDEYDVDVQAINTKQKSMDDVKLVYNTNRKINGSSNPGTIEDPISFFANIIAREVISYNVGYVRFRPDKNDSLSSWRYWKEEDADNLFLYLGAHELGHTILKAFKGTIKSYNHNHSSTITQARKKGDQYKYPEYGEIDVMKYYQDDPTFIDYNRTFAIKEDVEGLIWLSKLKL